MSLTVERRRTWTMMRGMILFLVGAALLFATSGCNANRSYVPSRPTGQRFFSNLLIGGAHAFPVNVPQPNYVFNHDSRSGAAPEAVGDHLESSTLESLLRDAFFGPESIEDPNYVNHENFASVRSIANIQATIIILAAAICLSLSPRRKMPVHQPIHQLEVVPGSHELRDVLFSAIALGVMLIGTSISIASRRGSTSAGSADIMFYGGITLSLGCLTLDTVLAMTIASSKPKRWGLLALALGICTTLVFVCRPDDLLGLDDGSNTMTVMKRLFSSNMQRTNSSSMGISNTPKGVELLNVLPMFAGLSVCFTTGFVVFLSCEFDNSSMSAIGTMCLLQTMIAGASVLKSMVMNDIKGTLAQTSFAFILGMIILGTTLLPRVCEMQFQNGPGFQEDDSFANLTDEDEPLKSTTMSSGLACKLADEKVVLMKRLVYKHCNNKNKTTCSPVPMTKPRAVRFKDDAQLVEYFDSGM